MYLFSGLFPVKRWVYVSKKSQCPLKSGRLSMNFYEVPGYSIERDNHVLNLCLCVLVRVFISGDTLPLA